MNLARPSATPREAWRTWLPLAGVLLISLVALLAMRHLLGDVRPRAVRAAFHQLSWGQLAAALGLTALSYLFLTLYDHLALRTIGKKLPWRVSALASFTSYTLSHNLGFALITGGTARFRVYRAAGLGVGEVGSVIALASLTFWYGILLIGGLGLMIRPEHVEIAGHVMPRSWQVLTGACAIGLLTVPLVMWTAGVRQVEFAGWSTPLPDIRHGLAMIATGALDLAAASAALFVLLPHADPAQFEALYFGYALAAVAAMISHVPGGIGVFEAVVLATVPGDKVQTLAALLAYRAIYYLIPLALALAMLAANETRRWHAPVSRVLRGGGSLAIELAPMVMSALTFTGGAILLVSGALPAVPARLHFLHDVLPLPFTEASHIAASLSGTMLLFLAPGLWRRLDGAYHATRLFLLAGMMFSLVKGLDYEEALALGIIAAGLHWSRSAFYRKTALLAEPLSPPWLTAAAVAIVCSVFVGEFAYKHVAYQNALWWEFSRHGDAARFLRASFAVAVAVVGLAVWHLFSAPARASRIDPHISPEVFARALGFSGKTDSFLALTGDKQFLVAPEGDAFVMYRVSGGNWIVMGDPVGNPARWSDLLWTLRQRADAHQGRLMLYQISAASLPIMVEMGLDIVKYGEEARVQLSRFSTEGKSGKDLRHAVRRAEASGASFEIVAAREVPVYMQELRAVSDEWLADKGAKEKAFSLGRFDPDYLARFDCAVVRMGGRIVAFANVLATPDRQELSVDLMRHVREVPYGVMDYLFVRLMEWGREQKYQWFSLGLAPLAGIEGRRLAPLWARVGAFMFRHGEAFYGFYGLRRYKAKFTTHWEPRYIAASKGLGLARGLAAVLRLVSHPGRDRRDPRGQLGAG